MKNLFLIFTLLFSFSANSRTVEITKIFSGSSMAACGLPVGTIFDSNITACPRVRPPDSDGTTYTFVSLVSSDGYITVVYLSSWANKHISSRATYIDSVCEKPNVINSLGVCESPPPPSFCESPEIEEKRQAEMELCTGAGGNYSETCTNEPEEWLPLCSDIPKPPECVPSPDNNWCDVPACSATNPNWPACLWPPEPDIDDNPDFDSSNPPSTTDPDESLNPNPELPPVLENNGDTLKAIVNFNKDNNELITRLNTDVNNGFITNNDRLDVINKNTIGFWQDSIDGFNNINQSINNQNDVIRQAGNMTNNYLGTLTNVVNSGLDDITNAIQKASEKDKIIDIADIPADDLYTDNSFNELNEDVDNLKIEYQEELNKFKSYFNFQTEINAGDYNSHTLKQSWGGKELTFDNFALTVFVDNADIIGLIIIFGFGIAGIRIILETV